MRRCTSIRSGMALAACLVLAATMGSPAFAQGTTGDPQNSWGTQVERAPPSARTTVVPRVEATTPGEVRMSAYLTDEGQPLASGLVWRVFQEPDSPPAAGAASGQPRLIETRREAAPVLRLPPGRYIVVVAFGRAHQTRPLSVESGVETTERFVLNAGGLKLAAVGSNGEPVPDMSVTYDIYAGSSDQVGGRPKIVSGARPGLVLRLNAGVYHVVSVLGDANAIVRADITVEPGKVTEAVVTHHSARITFKLVQRAGGDAQADTRWVVQTPQGETVVESTGAIASHILAAGSYVVSARHSGQTFRREFQVEPGDPAQVEIVMQ